ncbi:hypothetical protein KVV02_001518 [Mortierella alpina]|uniref:cAMP-independent regulatory protein pac2 n=1 Tax=Mortierella alpina TaxID=64518 RepID=A0A9P8AC12_MORAP|nr:hypothetical protein KVV02_001518 [Mortierella alpina]
MDPNSMETYYGLIKTPLDALIIFEGKVHRRLSDIERQSVRSGSVYCFDEREAGMRRWTDGKSWSPSRVTGSFLTYRELDDSQATQSSGKNVYRPDGLLKQSFSITTSENKKLHLISYYTNEDVASERLCDTPSRDPRFAGVVIPKGIYPETSPHSAADSHSASSTAQLSPSPPTPHRSRHRPHHRSFQHLNTSSREETRPRSAERHRRTGSSSSTASVTVGHRRTHSGSLSLKDHRYSPIQPSEGHHIHNAAYPGHYGIPSAYGPSHGAAHPEKRYKSSSPSARSSFPTPPSNAYSPTTSWASEDDQPLVADTVTPESLVECSSRDDELTPVMIPALREVPLIATSFDHRKGAIEPYSPSSASSATPAASVTGSHHEQDSLSVLANLATDTLLLPKLEPKVSRERVRWVEDDRQLRALSSMLRL